MVQRSLENKHVVITGASSGIGRAQTIWADVSLELECRALIDCAIMPVGTCARIISRAIETGRRAVVMTLKLNLAAKLYPFVPDLVDAWVVRSTRRFYAR